MQTAATASGGLTSYVVASFRDEILLIAEPLFVLQVVCCR